MTILSETSTNKISSAFSFILAVLARLLSAELGLSVHG
jgi:hypothetical protein